MDRGRKEGYQKSEGILRIISSPSTLPHFVVLAVLSATLYVSMRIDWFGSENQGGAIFLSLSIAYMIAALVQPSRVGRWMLTVDSGGKGILNRKYWIQGVVKVLPIFAAATGIWYASITIVGNDNLGNFKLFLAMMFVAMSLFQGITLSMGWTVYGKRIQSSSRASRSGGLSLLLRNVISLVILLPLVWWFGYGAENPSNANLSTNIAWLIFLLLIVFLGVLMERYTKNSRGRDGVDGIALDRAYFLIFITSCWHLLSSWRRAPFTASQSTPTLLIEEGVLMSISILLAVWSLSKRGQKKGWRIFQGQSAIFWGISFGFVYSGSISSLTVLSEGSLMITTAIGHAITAIVMLAISPIALSWIGEPSPLEEPKEVSDRQEQVHDANVMKIQKTADDEDIVELLD